MLISSVLGFLCGSAGKESACYMGNLGSIPGLGRSPGEGKGYPFQYPDLENSSSIHVLYWCLAKLIQCLRFKNKIKFKKKRKKISGIFWL